MQGLILHPLLMNKTQRYLNFSTWGRDIPNTEGAFHLFLVEKHSLKFRGAKSNHPSAHCTSCLSACKITSSEKSEDKTLRFPRMISPFLQLLLGLLSINTTYRIRDKGQPCFPTHTDSQLNLVLRMCTQLLHSRDWILVKSSLLTAWNKQHPGVTVLFFFFFWVRYPDNLDVYSLCFSNYSYYPTSGFCSRPQTPWNMGVLRNSHHIKVNKL